MIDDLRQAVFEDLARLIDRWISAGMEAFRGPEAKIAWAKDPDAFRSVAQALAKSGCGDRLEPVLRELITGFADSALAVIDGASKSAEIGRVHLTDDEGRSLGEGLHELFMDYLADTSRL